ncbi:signal transduction histidine kinase [Actinomadura luteofluorescens]|uniref:histidine kinase n=2 Tax=Actinomadura luteofluorescens TaxID=46163 RepID=A0A7Y9EMV0_9ACTN|nr:nitrate- and nitrite sensing domain-containing protein [Actinomadura luteofluorescens]NYD49940.1 signal transduction histidine kinase [Actinomadura luteofluorescens]
MVTVSVVSLGVLWAFAASIALGEGLNLRHVKTVQDHYGYPSGALGSALQAERRLSMVYLGGRAEGDRAAMESGRLVTDRQADLFRKLAESEAVDGAAPRDAQRIAGKILTELDGLDDRRRAIDAGRLDRARTFADYTALLGDVGALQGSLATLDNSEVAKDARNEASLTRAREVLAQEDALLAGALAAGKITPGEHSQYVKLVGTQRTLYTYTAAELRSPDQAYYERIVGMPEYSRLRTLEDRFVAMPRLVNATGTAGALWKTTADSNLTRLRGLELSVSAGAEKRAQPISEGIITRVVLAGALGLVAVVATLVLAVWVARSVIRELRRLRREAIDLADVRLPGVIRRLRRGEEVDVAAEAPPLAFGTREIDQVGEAFNAARRTAIQSAVEEATLRRNVSDVFVNLARRSQTLLHRQLKLLDSMERRIETPDDLEDLFRVDHLATRMRRHAEGLIILSGQAPGRGWRSPVAIVDVARAAASEVEDYTRVNVAPMTRAAIVGPAVADVIHLLAELIENAATFSPPHTTVQVQGQAVSHGFTLEVEDRGLSMDEPSLAAANERLATAAEFDLSDSAQLGLFVVGRLARRHGIKVTLRTSPYGGMTAIVLLPEELVVPDEGGPAQSAPALTTRRAEDALVPVGTVVGGASVRSGPQPVLDEGGSVLHLPSGRHAAQSAVPSPSPSPSPSPTPPPEPLAQPAQPVRPFIPPASAMSPSGEPSGEPDALTGPIPVFEEPIQGPSPAPRPAASPWGDPPPEPASAPPPPPPSVPRSPREVRRRPPGKSPGSDRPSLPKRVRQENMASQLREERSEPAAPAPAARADRSPEQLRSMMSSIQRGTRRGRAESLDTEES